MNCPHCGANNRAEARFCLSCGMTLSAQPEPSAEAVVIETAPPNASPPAELVPDEPPSTDEITLNTSPAHPSTLNQMATIIPNHQPPLPAAIDFDPVVTQVDEPDTAEKSPPIDLSDTDDALLPDGQPTQPLSANVAAEELLLVEIDTNVGETDPEPSSTTVEAAPIGVLVPGYRLQDRFEIIELLSQNETETVYLARDSARCGQCGTANEPADCFCITCGAELSPEQQQCRVQEATALPPQIPPQSWSQFEENGRWYLALPLTDPIAAIAPPANFRLAVGLASHPGQIRERDEDSLLALTFNGMFDGNFAPAVGFYAVADGMGGHEAGEVASRLALQVIAEWLTMHLLLPELRGECCFEETAVERLKEAVQKANGEIFVQRHRLSNEMGTTLTAALVLHDAAIVANVGDSRTYLWRGGALQQITTDHSAVARLIAVGEAQPEEIYTHPQKSAIYRSLGDKPNVETVDVFTTPLQTGDRLVLCCDGIWESIRPEGIEEVLLAWHDPQPAAAEIVKQANLAGGQDNLSVIVVAAVGS